MIELEDNKLSTLNGLIRSYHQNKVSLENYRNMVDTQNGEIKTIMQNNHLTKYTTMDGLVANLTTQKRENFIDSKLISKLKELGVTSPIKTVEVVDMDELENVIYNHQLDASQLNDCKEVKEILVLKVKEGKNE